MCVANDELCVAARNENSINIYSFDGILQRRIQTQLPMGVVFDKYRNQIVVGSSFCMQAFSMLNLLLRHPAGLAELLFLRCFQSSARV